MVEESFISLKEEDSEILKETFTTLEKKSIVKPKLCQVYGVTPCFVSQGFLEWIKVLEIHGPYN